MHAAVAMAARMPRAGHLLASWATIMKLKTVILEAVPLLLCREDSMQHWATHYT